MLWNRKVAKQSKRRNQKIETEAPRDEDEEQLDEEQDIREIHWRERLLDIIIALN